MRKNLLKIATLLIPILMVTIIPIWPSASRTPASPMAGETYKGVWPCADCPGIQVELTLNNSPAESFGTFQMSSVYQERNVKALLEKGEWRILKGTAERPLIYQLTFDPNGRTQFFKRINPTQLRLLDQNQNPLPASMPYTLTKVAANLPAGLPNREKPVR